MYPRHHSPYPFLKAANIDLALADTEHFRLAVWVSPLSSRLAIFHGYSLGIIRFPFSSFMFPSIRSRVIAVLELARELPQNADFVATKRLY